MNYLSSIIEDIETMKRLFILLEILKWLIIALVVIVVLYFVIRATCRYQAKENAKAFDYDYLAERTAAEICQRLMIIEAQKKEHKGATPSAEDQGRGDRDGAPEQDESRQE